MKYWLKVLIRLAVVAAIFWAGGVGGYNLANQAPAAGNWWFSGKAHEWLTAIGTVGAVVFAVGKCGNTR